VATFLERLWKRHSNPWSVWTRILSYPLVYVPVWDRSWKQGAAVAAWFAANPVLFSEPKGDEPWATRGVLGEELWTAERPWDLSMLINTASAAFFAGGLLATYRRRLWPMVFFASVALLLKLWNIDRMTFYYAQHRKREEPAEEAETATTPPSS
jgi:hypothetical protein